IAAAARRGLPVALHTPSEVKAAVTGSGRADKAQVGVMVARLLAVGSVPGPPDAADALALAICHLWRGTATDRIAAGSAQPPSRVPRTLAQARAVAPR
ncbi:MAG TPA: crossover junction endodeoxyribonuclease RuvC, partial [Candidatus Nanopelagicales bacterium]|nr:crossover junction endodeoxyribonuclease RuvC [Candidatus Nanopelagicales bacterium]